MYEARNHLLIFERLIRGKPQPPDYEHIIGPCALLIHRQHLHLLRTTFSGYTESKKIYNFCVHTTQLTCLHRISVGHISLVY